MRGLRLCVALLLCGCSGSTGDGGNDVATSSESTTSTTTSSSGDTSTTSSGSGTDGSSTTSDSESESSSGASSSGSSSGAADDTTSSGGTSGSGGSSESTGGVSTACADGCVVEFMCGTEWQSEQECVDWCAQNLIEAGLFSQYCADAWEAVSACFATLTCEQFLEHEAPQAFPYPCSDEDSVLAIECKGQ